MKVEIMRVWEEDGWKVYGARKVWRELNRQGTVVARCTVERLMRELGIEGACARRKRPRTTVPGDGRQPADLLERDFDAPAPNTFSARHRPGISDAVSGRRVGPGRCPARGQTEPRPLTWHGPRSSIRASPPSSYVRLCAWTNRRKSCQVCRASLRRARCCRRAGRRSSRWSPARPQPGRWRRRWRRT
ncbi:IS3 family transposase [Sphaerimonospora mesophila]|uniref:IS3 family transposase n=1 Tax=Sphaerimonospora mesophila TaxID=37483 RepID=UPI003D70FF87